MNSTLGRDNPDRDPIQSVRAVHVDRGDVWLASSSRDPQIRRVIVVENVADDNHVVALAASNLIEMASDSDLALPANETGLAFPVLVQSLVVGPLLISQLIRRLGRVAEPTLDALATLRAGDEVALDVGTTTVELRACPPGYRRYQGPPLSGFSGARWRFKRTEAAEMRVLCAEAYEVLSQAEQPEGRSIPTLDERRILRDEVGRLLARASVAPGRGATEHGELATVAFAWIPRDEDAEDDLSIHVMLPDRYDSVREDLVVVLQDPPDVRGAAQRGEALEHEGPLTFAKTARGGRLFLVDRMLEPRERALALAAASGEGPYQDTARRYRADVSRDTDRNGTVTFDGPPGRDIEWVEFTLWAPQWSSTSRATRHLLVPMYAESDQSRRRAVMQVTAEDTIPDGPLRTVVNPQLDRIDADVLRESIVRSADDPWTMSAWRALAHQNPRVATLVSEMRAGDSDSTP